MLGSVLVSCGETAKGGNEGNTQKAPSGGSSSDVGEIEFYEDLPQMDWGGEEYRILGREFDENNFKNFEVDYEEMPEDVVGLAVWNRNAAIKAKYGLDVVGKLVDEKPHIPAKLVLESGEDRYDLIICASDQHHPFAIQGYLVNMADLKYVNLEKDCWNAYANEQLTMGGKLSRLFLSPHHSATISRTLCSASCIGVVPSASGFIHSLWRCLTSACVPSGRSSSKAIVVSGGICLESSTTELKPSRGSRLFTSSPE